MLIRPDNPQFQRSLSFEILLPDIETHDISCWRCDNIICVPGIKYNAEKEEKAKQDAKQKKLAQIEEAKKLEAEKGRWSLLCWWWW